MILMLRLLPFIPSGAINLTAALSRTGMMIFFLATSIGKLPAPPCRGIFGNTGIEGIGRYKDCFDTVDSRNLSRLLL
ncbi:hypothetical protein RCO48_36900 [Peribacillus frigoritolerans]|nr:hypothetical protein [Peribacillus frigoritolerans]